MSFLSSLHAATPPPVAVEIAANRVAAAAIEFRGGRAVLSAHAAEPLPEGVLVPSLTGTNVHDRAAIIGALGRVFDRLGGRPRRIGLVIPDSVAKVSLVRFEQVPARRLDLDQLVRWQVRKAAPFPIEEAAVSYAPGIGGADGQEFIVVSARREAIREYEEICGELGSHPGLVDLATFNVVNAVLAGSTPPTGDWLLVNITADYASIAILRDARLIFFRNRAAETEGTLANLVHQTGMYYEDRLSGTGFSRVLLAGSAGEGVRQAADAEQARQSLAERLTIAVETVDPRTAVTLTDRISVAPALLDTLVPLVGLLLRGQETTA
ncbi:MAG: pilus assembly protein PilM [Acidobacteriota bacterium]